MERQGVDKPTPPPRIPYDAPLGARICDKLCFPEYAQPLEGSEADIKPIGPYLRQNPGLLLMLFAKMSGALTWSDNDYFLATAAYIHTRINIKLMANCWLLGSRGLAELIEVELSALSSFQLRGSWGTPSATLG